MANVFLSYDRADAAKARRIAGALEQAGHSVWWDRHIKGGAQYSKEIEVALKKADAVIVLWSAASVDSAWVRDEAALGRDTGRLVPISLDEVEPPLGFRQYLTIDFSRWKGGAQVACFKELETAVGAFGETEVTPAGLPDRQEPARRFAGRTLLLALAGLVAVLAAAALFVWRPWAPRPATPIVAVQAAAGADSSALARDLFVQLGNVQAVTDAVQLIDENAGESPDLVLEVSGSTSASRPAANLVLLRGKDRQLLSSHALEAAGGGLADLKQALAIQATTVLRCAADTMRPREGALPHANQKLYLTACDAFAMTYGSPEVPILHRQLEQLVEVEPAFAPAWGQLLLIEASRQALPTDGGRPPPQSLRSHIAAARGLNGAMPEIGIAEMELMPPTDFRRRIQQSDDLVRRFPDNPLVLIARADQLMRVGRLNDAVIDAEEAERLDPASPITRNEYIRSLAYSGRIPRALQELAESAPLSLEAQNLREARFRLNMRYGDPRLALQMLRSHGTSKQHESFLEARIDPTPDKIETALSVSRATAAETRVYGSHAEVLTAFGRNDELYLLLMRLPTDRLDAWLAGTLFRPNLKAFRQDPRFLNVARRFGMLGYWRASGKWPDFCAEADLPYDCKQEADRIAGATG